MECSIVNIDTTEADQEAPAGPELLPIESARGSSVPEEPALRFVKARRRHSRLAANFEQTVPEDRGKVGRYCTRYIKYVPVPYPGR